VIGSQQRHCSLIEQQRQLRHYLHDLKVVVSTDSCASFHRYFETWHWKLREVDLGFTFGHRCSIA